MEVDVFSAVEASSCPAACLIEVEPAGLSSGSWSARSWRPYRKNISLKVPIAFNNCHIRYFLRPSAWLSDS